MARSFTLSAADTEALVYTLLGEAEGEGVEGMRAVASVIVNRTKHGGFAPDPVAVVSQPKQFDGGPGTPRYEKVKALYPPGSDEYAQAVRVVASHIAAPNPVDATGVNAVFFDTDGKTQKKYAGGTTTRIGRHFFYEGDGRQGNAVAAVSTEAQSSALDAIAEATSATVVDYTAKGGKLADGTLGTVVGLVVHHTGTGPSSSVDSIISILQQRGKGVQFVMDRDGVVYQLVPDGARAEHVRGLNSSYIGLEVIAADDSDITQEQANAIRGFSKQVLARYGLQMTPETLLGHMDLKGQDKRRSEGQTLRWVALAQEGFAPPTGRIFGDDGVGNPTKTWGQLGITIDGAAVSAAGLVDGAGEPMSFVEQDGLTPFERAVLNVRDRSLGQIVADDRAEAIAYARENARAQAMAAMGIVEPVAAGATRLGGGFESDIWADGIGSLFDDRGEVSSMPADEAFYGDTSLLAVTPRVELGSDLSGRTDAVIVGNQPLPGALMAEARRSLFSQPPEAAGVRVFTTTDRYGDFNRYTLPNLPSSVLTGIVKANIPMGASGRGGVGRDALNAVRPEGEVQFASRIDARPEVPGSMPAAPFVSDFPARPEVPGALPAAPREGFQPTVAVRPEGEIPFVSRVDGRPDAPIGQMPAARPGTTVVGRPVVPVGELPAAPAQPTMDIDVTVGWVGLPRPRPATVETPYVYTINVPQAAKAVREHAAKEFGPLLASVALLGKNDEAVVAMIFEQKDKETGAPMIPPEVVYDPKTQTVTTSSREYASIIAGLNDGLPPGMIKQLDQFVRPVLVKASGGLSVVGKVPPPVVLPIVQRKTVPATALKAMMDSTINAPAAAAAAAKPKPPSMATVKPAWGATPPTLVAPQPAPPKPKTVDDAAVRKPVVETWSTMAAAKPAAPVYKIVPAVYKTVPVSPPVGQAASGAYNVTPDQRAAFGGTDAKSAAVVAKAAGGTTVPAAPPPAVPAPPQVTRVLVTPARRIQVSPGGGVTVPERYVAPQPKRYTAGGRTYVAKNGMMVNEKTGVKYARTAVYGEGGGDYGSSPGQITAGLKPGDRVYNPDTNSWGLKR